MPTTWTRDPSTTVPSRGFRLPLDALNSGSPPSRQAFLDQHPTIAGALLPELVQFFFGEGDTGCRSFVVKDLGGDHIVSGSEDVEVVETLDGDEVDQAVRRGAGHRLQSSEVARSVGALKDKQGAAHRVQPAAG